MTRRVPSFGLAIFGCALLCVHGVFAQRAAARNGYLQSAWTTEQGLPQNTITAICQTRDGYLWLGTFGGLARFDGARFTIFNSSNTPELKSNRVRALHADVAGDLWIGTEQGGLIRHRQGSFTSFALPGELAENSALALAGAEGGGLWVGASGGLARFHHERWELAADTGLPRVEVIALYSGRDGGLWVGTEGRGVFHLRNDRTLDYAAKEELPSALAYCFSETSDGTVWIGTEKGLARFQAGKISRVALPDDARVGRVRALGVDARGDLWVGAHTGLFRLSGEGVVKFTIRDGLSNEYIRTLWPDSEGNLWIGTDVGGLNRWRRGNITLPEAAGLPAASALPIYEDRAGNVWVGLLGQGLYQARDGRLQAYPLGGLYKNISAIAEDAEGHLWIGSFDEGVGRLERDGVRRFTTAQGLSENVVRALYCDAQGTLWIGTNGGGLNRFRDGHFTVYRTRDGLLHDHVAFITQDRQGALWLGTANGISRFQDGQFNNYQAGGLTLVRTIHEDTDGSLWIGTYGHGLSRFKDGRFTRITKQQGLFEDVVSRILEDDQGNFWMSGNRGIFRASRQELSDFADGRLKSVTCVSYGAADGMLTGESNGGGQPAGWRTRAGELWFPTVKGAVVIDPKRLNQQPPPVFIEQVKLDETTLPAPQFLRIHPGQENLEIHYTGLDFSRAEHVRFKYRMEGLDADWVDAGTRRASYHSHLPPGQYTFRVIAANGDGVWNTAGAALRIEVVPRFWQRWWFSLLALAAIGGVGWLAHQVRVGQLQRRQAEQDVFARRLLESQESERKRIAAELHDSLGQRLVVIKNLALLLLHRAHDPAETRQQIAGISDETSRAIHEVKEISYNLRPHQLEQVGLTKTIHGIVSQMAHASGIEITAELDPLDKLFAPEAEISLYRIVQESLNNIVKHSGAASARLSILRKDASIELTLRDDGRGFTSDAGTGGRGFGLTGIAERVRMLGGTSSIQSAPGAGTLIHITIGLPHEHIQQ